MDDAGMMGPDGWGCASMQSVGHARMHVWRTDPGSDKTDEIIKHAILAG